MNKLILSVVAMVMATGVAFANYQTRQNGGSLEFRNFLESRTEALELDRHSVVKMDKYNRHYDDFNGDVLADEWNAVAGTESTAFAVSTTGLNGVIRGTAASTTSTLSDTILLNAGTLNYKPSQGGLVVEAYLRPTEITDTLVFVGFTDSTALEVPITISSGTSSTAVATATDAVGLIYDTNGDPNVWHAVGVATGVTKTSVSTGLAASDANYQAVRVVVDSDGDATFYINETQYATIGRAITASAVVTPVVVGKGHNNEVLLDVDYIQVQQKR